MKIDTFLEPPVRLPDIKNERTVVVMIDVLRASTSICTAISNGAHEIIPCRTIEEAFEIKNHYDNIDILLCGERQGIKPEGFDLGNSPFEYSPEAVGGRTLILTTTNGTGIFSLANDKADFFIGSFNNRKFLAEYIANSVYERAVLICAGTEGCFTFEDAVCAGAIINDIGLKKAVGKSDSSIAAELLYNIHKAGLQETDIPGYHVKYLKSIGFINDVRYAFNCDTLDIIPVIKDGKIIKN